MLHAIGWIADLARALVGVGGVAAAFAPEVMANFRRHLLFAALSGVFTGVVWNYYPVVARRLGASELLLSLMMTASYMGAVLAIAAPYVLNTVQPARRLAVLWSAGRLLWVAALFVATPVPFAAIVVAYYILIGLCFPGYTWTLQGAYPARIRGRLLGTAQAAMSLTALVAVPVAGRLLDSVGHGPVLATAGVVGALAALVFAGVRILEPKPRPRPRLGPWELARRAWRNRSFRNYALGYNVMGLGVGILTPTVPIVLVDELDASFTTVGVLVLVQGLAAGLSFVVWGRIADRWSGPYATFAGILLFAVAPPLYIPAILAGNVWVLPAAYLVGGVAGAGFTLGWQTSLMSMASPEETAPLVTAFFISVGLLGMGGPFLGGLLLLVGGPFAALSATLALVLGGAAVMWYAARAFQPVTDGSQHPADASKPVQLA